MRARVGLGMRTLLAILLALAVLPAFAQSNEDVIASYWKWGSSANEPTAQLACNHIYEGNSTATPAAPVITGTAPQRTAQCRYTRNSDGALLEPGIALEGCPVGYNSNPSAGHQHCDRPTTCASKTGQTKTMNITAGWARSNDPNMNDIVVNGPVDASQCDGSCMLSLAPVAKAAWRSQVPAANGLHRVSGDFTATYTGAACTSVSPNANPAAAAPPCPGTLGNVNGKPVCFGTGSTPLPLSPKPPNTPPEGFGNPPAGEPPSSGPQTPAAGNGGPAGGGSNAGIPGGGSEGNGQGTGTPGGTNPDGTGTGNNGTGTGSGGGGGSGMDPCGLPGTPPCKIDETGTPDGSALGSAANGVKTAGTALTTAVSGVDKPSSLGWSFSLTLPTGACTDFQMYRPGGTWGVGLCDNSYVQIIREILAWAMGILAAVYCYRSVTRTIAHQE